MPRLLYINVLLWAGFVGWNWPVGLQHTVWVEILLLFVPLVMVPKLSDMNPFGIIAGYAFLIALILPQGIWAAIFSIPWILFSATQAWKQRHAFTYTFLLIGAAWFFADRLGWMVLNFSPIIVLLTAAHFHYAGFLLSLLSEKLENPRLSIAIAVGVVGVAIGITATQLNGPQWIETAAAVFMAGIGSIAAWKLILARRFLLLLAGICLQAGMLLAFLYGIRAYFPIAILSIPFMYALHGTLNAFALILANIFLDSPGARQSPLPSGSPELS